VKLDKNDVYVGAIVWVSQHDGVFYEIVRVEDDPLCRSSQIWLKYWGSLPDDMLSWSARRQCISMRESGRSEWTTLESLRRPNPYLLLAIA
jgi:hypothetical protein